MLKQLLGLFRTDDSIASMGSRFSTMLGDSRDITVGAGHVFFGESSEDDERTEISKRDVAINKLERDIRRRVISHLTLSANAGDVPYCLLLMSIVKDVERIGDYAKNLAEVHHDGGAAIPHDENGEELRGIRSVIEATFAEVNKVFVSSDAGSATELITEGRAVNRRCDSLIGTVARSDYDAATATSMVLGARYYKRISSHLMNVLSGVVMPLHKLDYYDERATLIDEDEASAEED